MSVPSATRRSLLFAGLAGAAGVRAQAMPEDLDTPFVITPTNVVTAMLDMANVRAGDRLLDLGSGDGRIVIAAAQRGAIATGIEIDQKLVRLSREHARRLNLGERATFVTRDLFDTRYDGYDVITLYLLPDVNRRLAPKFLALKAGTRIVSHDYGLGDWTADRTIVVDAPDKPVNAVKKSTILFWRVPARIAGRWRGEAGGVLIDLQLEQSYQTVAGSLRWRGRDHAFDGARVDGAGVTLAIPAADLAISLHAIGDRLDGELRERDRPPLHLVLTH